MYSVGQPIQISGYIDDFHRGITAVEFSLDSGAHWTAYSTQNCTADRGVSWNFAYTPKTPGTYVLIMRARCADGTISDVLGSFLFQAQDSPIEASLPAVAPLDSRIRPVGRTQSPHAALYRSPSPEMLGVEGIQSAAALNLDTVYDLRSPAEISTSGLRLFSGVQTVSLTPRTDARRKDAEKRLVAGVISKYGEPGQRMCANYRRYVSEYPMMGFALRSIAAQGQRALIHCVNGKDRTGVLCAVIETIAGLEPEEILAHYLATNQVNAELITADEARLSPGMSQREHEILMSFLEARAEYLSAFFQEVQIRFGSFDRYVTDALHLSPQQIQMVKYLAG